MDLDEKGSAVSPDNNGRYEQLKLLAGSKTLAVQVYEALERGIVMGALEPGARINVDELAENLGVSRIPVREALRSLDANGWVEIRPRLGVYVSSRTRRELLDLFEMRALLEPEVARLACERRTAEQLEQLEKLVEEGQRAVEAGDAIGFSLTNRIFHEVVADATHNEVLARASKGILMRVSFYLTGVPDDRIERSSHDHEDLVEALASQDGARASELILQHIRETEVDLNEKMGEYDD